MIIDKEFAMQFWRRIYGDEKFAMDCFGTWMCRDAYSNECVSMRNRSGSNKYYDYSWNIDHIRPKASFSSESEADFLNNLEPMHRQNNLQKSDNYSTFQVDGKTYHIVKDYYSGGYGITDDNGRRIDWKKNGRHF